jgi:hypothetical protein
MRKKALGRNQWIAIIAFSLTFSASIVLVAVRLVSGEAWLHFAGSFVPISVAVITGGSALIKSAEAIRGPCASLPVVPSVMTGTLPPDANIGVAP